MSKDDEDDDPAQTKAINDWIVAVLQRGGVKVHRTNGSLGLFDVPARWAAIVQALCDGIHAAARGQELPEIAPPPKTTKTTRKRS